MTRFLLEFLFKVFRKTLVFCFFPHCVDELGKRVCVSYLCKIDKNFSSYRFFFALLPINKSAQTNIAQPLEERHAQWQTSLASIVRESGTSSLWEWCSCEYFNGTSRRSIALTATFPFLTILLCLICWVSLLGGGLFIFFSQIQQCVIARYESKSLW